VLDWQLSAAAQRLYTNTARRVGEMEMESAAATARVLRLCKVLCLLPLTASRNTRFLASSARQSYGTLIGEYLTPDYWVIKAQQASPPPPSGDRPTIHTAVTLPAQWPT